MTITIITSRKFNQDVGHAKRAAAAGPVVITDRGRPAYVLLRHDAYRHLVDKGGSNIRQLLDQPGAPAVDFEPPRWGSGLFRAPELGLRG